MATLATAITRGLLSARPATGAGKGGQTYYATDEHTVYHDDGSGWLLVATNVTAISEVPGLVAALAAKADDAATTSALAGKQASDSDLTAIAALTPSNDDLLQRKSGAWTNRTIAQVKTDLAIVPGDVTGFDTQVRTNRLDQMAAPTADVSLNSHKLTNVTDPASAQDAATKNYVDLIASGLRDFKQSVRATTTANGTLATAFANGQSIDGVTLVTGDRILIKDQTSGAENGIYTVNASGAPTRATDADSSAEVTPGMFVFVEEGTTLHDTGWVLNTDAPITLGTTALVFAQFSNASGGLLAANNLSDVANAATARTNLGLAIGTNVAAPNQDTTGKAAKTDALNSATTVVNVSAATAPTTGQVLTATDSTHATWQTPSAGGAALTVEEVDGSPTDSAVTKIVFPNGTLAIASHVATYTPAAGGTGDLLFARTLPVTADLSWWQQGSASYSDTRGWILNAVQHSGAYEFRGMEVPLGAYSAKVTVMMQPSHTRIEFGPHLRDSSGTKFVNFIHDNVNGGYLLIKWNSNGNVAAITSGLGTSHEPGAVLMRLEESGGNYVGSISYDGINWSTVGTLAISSFMTTDKLGFSARVSAYFTPAPVKIRHLSFGSTSIAAS